MNKRAWFSFSIYSLIVGAVVVWLSGPAACFSEGKPARPGPKVSVIGSVFGPDGGLCSRQLAVEARPGGMLEMITTLEPDGSFTALHVSPPARRAVMGIPGTIAQIQITEVPVGRAALSKGADWQRKVRTGERITNFRMLTELNYAALGTEAVGAPGGTSNRKPAMRDPLGGGAGNYICTYQQMINAECGFSGCAVGSGTCFQLDGGSDSRCQACR